MNESAASRNLVDRPYRRIACEEGFLIPEVIEATKRFYERGGAHAERVRTFLSMYDSGDGKRILDKWTRELLDIGAGRVAHMDETGIDAQMLLCSIQGVQLFDAVEAVELSRVVNDRLSVAQKEHPGRLYGLAAIPPQNPEAAAIELERAINTLGLKGAMVNGHTHDERLDHKKFRPIFEALNALKVPLYIHPREAPVDSLDAHLPYALEGAIWGYASETALHALRLIFSGLFDDYPDLQICLGHGGEGIPFFLNRLDRRHAVEGQGIRGRANLKMQPSEYFKRNFSITTSGMNDLPAIRYCQEVLGEDKVLFAVDYPFEDNIPAVETTESAGFSPELAKKFFQTNAEKFFNLV